MSNEELVIRIKAGMDTANNMLLLWQQNKGIIAKVALRYRGCLITEESLEAPYYWPSRDFALYGNVFRYHVGGGLD